MLGQQIDDRLGDGERHPGGDDRQQPEHRAAVGDQQQDDDHRQGPVEQRGIDALEDLYRVGGAGGGPGDVHGEPGVTAGGRGAQVVDEPLDVGVVAEAGPDDHLHRLVIAGGDGPGHPAVDGWQGGEKPGVGGGLVQVGGGEPGWPDVDDNGRVEVLGGELGLQVELLRGLRARGQVSGGVVLLGAHQLARQRPGEREHDHPEDEHNVLGPAAAGQCRDPACPARARCAWWGGTFGGHAILSRGMSR